MPGDAPLSLTLDFETHYDETGYSLRKMPTAQYVRDARFRVLGAAVALDGAPAVWLEPGPLREFFAAVPWHRVTLVAHNAAFDGLVLTEHYGHRPARYACTLSMVRYLIAQGEVDAETTSSLKAAAPLVGMGKGDLAAAHDAGELDTYATLDADICSALYAWGRDRVPPDEWDYIDIHVRMMAEPSLALDVVTLERIKAQDEAVEALFPVVRKDAGFAEALEALGVSAVYKTTAKGTFKLATSKTDGWLETLREHANPAVRMLAEIRQKASSTIERTRAARMLDAGSPYPIPLLYYGAHTGRASGQDKQNPQNLKRDGELRGCLMAPPGHRLIIVDSSQIEVRVLAWLAGEDALLDVFRRGEDPYIEFAATHLYAKPHADVAKAERQVAKAAVLALGFGQGPGGFLAYCEAVGVPMDAETAGYVVRTYRRAYPRIVAYWKAVEKQVRLHGHTVLPSGRKLTYPALWDGDDGLEYRRAAIFRKAKSEGFSNLWHGLLTENAVQAAARDVVFHQSRRLIRAGWRAAMMVHDETVLVVPEDKAEEALRAALVSFGSTPPFMPGLPVQGEAHIAERYGK